MFLFGKSNKVANIVIDDYVIRLVQNNGNDLNSIKLIAEKALPLDTIINGKIVDELIFYEFMKELVQEWGIKHHRVRFYVPHSLIILRNLEIPSHIQKTEWKQYITLEIGNTIHFPFKNPVFDLYDPAANQPNTVTVIAAPEEEITKYAVIFEDVSLKPTAVDVQAIGVYRYFLQQQQLDANKVFLFVELNLTSVNISIFHQHQFEFHRHQLLSVIKNNWESSGEPFLRWNYVGDENRLLGEIDDQLNEIERLLNFYRFSIHQGEKSVTDIVLLGDFPNIKQIATKIKERYPLPLTLLTTENIQANFQVSDAFIPVLGLAIKGGK